MFNAKQTKRNTQQRQQKTSTDSTVSNPMNSKLPSGNANNPAARLYIILAKIKQSPDNKLRNAIASLADISPTHTTEIFIFINDLVGLSKDAQHRMRRIKSFNHDAYIKTLTKIETGLLTANIDILVKSFAKNNLSDIDMLSLKATADMLSTVYTDTTIPVNKIDALHKEVQDLLNETLNTQLPDDLKIFLVEKLQQMVHAIMGYRIKGNQGLQEAIEAALGATFLHRDELVKHSNKDEKVKKVLEKFMLVVEKATTILSLAEKAKSLSPPSINLLLPPYSK